MARPTERAFLRVALRTYLPTYIGLRFYGWSKRTPSFVQNHYDLQRGAMRQGFEQNPPTLENYLFGSEEEKEFCLLDDRIVYGPLRHARQAVMQSIERYLGRYLSEGHGAIIEFGCGDGRNLLYLKKIYPDARLIGLDFSPESVRLAKLASSHFNLPVEFIEADVALSRLALTEKVAVVFSCHALEGMPRTFTKAVDHMVGLAEEAVFMFEPVTELYSHDLRGRLSKWRVFMLDRLRGLVPYVRRKGYRIAVAERLRHAVNPLNEPCVIALTKTGAPPHA